MDPPKGAPPRGRRAPTKSKSSLRTKKELHKGTSSGILYSAKPKTWEKLMELIADNSIPKYKWELKRTCFDRLEAIASLAIRGEPTA